MKSGLSRTRRHSSRESGLCFPESETVFTRIGAVFSRGRYPALLSSRSLSSRFRRLRFRECPIRCAREASDTSFASVKCAIREAPLREQRARCPNPRSSPCPYSGTPGCVSLVTAASRGVRLPHIALSVSIPRYTAALRGGGYVSPIVDFRAPYSGTPGWRDGVEVSASRLQAVTAAPGGRRAVIQRNPGLVIRRFTSSTEASPDYTAALW